MISEYDSFYEPKSFDYFFILRKFQNHELVYGLLKL